MSKKTLFVVSDAVVAPTGFGRVAEAVLDRLHETGKWTIKQLGINYFDQDHDKPYRIFSASGGGTAFGDWAGYGRIKSLYAELKPDVTWLFQDFWHIAQYMAAAPELERIVTYFPVDSPNIKSVWALPQAYAEEVCTYTEFGAKELSKAMSHVISRVAKSAVDSGKEMVKQINLESNEGGLLAIPAEKAARLTTPENINVIPHGTDTSKFYPIDKGLARDLFGFDSSWFIVGNINRNQSRKRLDLTIKAFAEFAKDKPDVRLLLHDPIKTPEGWDLNQLADEYYNIGDKVLLSNETLEIKKLNQLYNTIDVMVNTGGGEGWGLCSSESACAKVAQIVPNWSATGEIWADSGILLDITSVRHEDGRINTAQCVIDTDHLVRELEDFYAKPEKVTEVGEACFQTMMNPDYDWDQIAKTFETIFEKVSERKEREYPEIKIVDGKLELS
jgi:glycosyltransferase involved in cell wall biosynthesis